MSIYTILHEIPKNCSDHYHPLSLPPSGFHFDWVLFLLGFQEISEGYHDGEIGIYRMRYPSHCMGQSLWK